MAVSASERLQQTIGLARTWEAMPHSGSRPIRAVAFGTGVRVRRLAEAIRVLGPEYDYEARLQVRSILELYFNYAWIRLKRRHSRATRFLRFQPLEKLKVAETLTKNSPSRMRELGPHTARLRKRRTSLRYLFRAKDGKGRLRWARDWAGGLSFESRLEEVVAASRTSGQSVDHFLYSLYRWLSGTVHGSAQSFEDVLTAANGAIRSKTNEELASNMSQDAATASLLAVWSLAARDLQLPREVRSDIDQRLRDLVHSLTMEHNASQ